MDMKGRSYFMYMQVKYFNKTLFDSEKYLSKFIVAGSK